MLLFVLFTMRFHFDFSSEEKDKADSTDEKGNELFVVVVTIFCVVCLLLLLFFLCAAAGSGAASSSRNLWVSGLSSTSRAADLKALFSKHGKVSPDNLFLTNISSSNCLLMFDFFFFFLNLSANSVFKKVLFIFYASCRFVALRW